MSREARLFQTFGEELRTARQAQHRSIDEIAQRTRINRRFLEAIELGDLAQLPPGPYTRAFLREYARAVGCKVPQELAHIENTPNPISSSVSILPQVGKRGTAGTTRVSPDASTKHVTGAAEQFGAALRATKELPKKANQAARTAARTTEKVIKRVENGAKEAVDVFTSKSLWDEAEQVRRERRGLPTPHDTESGTAVRVNNDAGFNIRDIRESRGGADTENEAFDESRARPSEDADEPLIVADATSKGPRTGIFSPTNVVIMTAVVLFAGVMAFALHLNKTDKTQADVTQQSNDVAKEEPAKAKIPVTEPRAAVAPVTQPGVDSLRFVVRAKSPVWVSIMPDSKTPFTGQLKAGETRSFAAGEKFVVNLGDQNALDMTFNGQALSHLPTIPKSGIVVRDLILTHDHVTLGGRPLTMSGAAVTPPTTATPAKSNPKIIAPHVAVPGNPAVKKVSNSDKPKPATTPPHKRQVKKTIPPVEPLPALP